MPTLAPPGLAVRAGCAPGTPHVWPAQTGRRPAGNHESLVRRNPCAPTQRCARPRPAPGMHKQMGIQAVAGGVQPAQPPRYPQPRLIKMHHLCPLQLLHRGCFHPCRQFIPLFQCRLYGLTVQRVSKQVLEQAADLLQRHVVIHRQLGDQRPHSRPILHAACHISRVDAALRLPAACDFSQPMFGHCQPRPWHIKHLSLARHLVRFMRRDDPPTPSATRWQMHLHLVGLLHRL